MYRFKCTLNADGGRSPGAGGGGGGGGGNVGRKCSAPAASYGIGGPGCGNIGGDGGRVAAVAAAVAAVGVPGGGTGVYSHPKWEAQSPQYAMRHANLR
jgi:hypothetical protein